MFQMIKAVIFIILLFVFASIQGRCAQMWGLQNGSGRGGLFGRGSPVPPPAPPHWPSASPTATPAAAASISIAVPSSPIAIMPTTMASPTTDTIEIHTAKAAPEPPPTDPLAAELYACNNQFGFAESGMYDQLNDDQIKLLTRRHKLTQGQGLDEGYRQCMAQVRILDQLRDLPPQTWDMELKRDALKTYAGE